MVYRIRQWGSWFIFDGAVLIVESIALGAISTNNLKNCLYSEAGDTHTKIIQYPLLRVL